MKLNLGCGRQKKDGYIGIDITQYIDGNGHKMVDHVLDVEKTRIPFNDNSLEEILAENVFEHLGDGFIHCLNECHRTLQGTGSLIGCVPVAGTRVDFMDITHKRHFIEESFDYICGDNLAMKNRPSHPRYADYGVLPWIKNSLIIENDLIYFNLSPKKI